MARPTEERDQDATVYIGNLDECFWQDPRDPDTGNSKGYGFISYDKFDSSDAAIDAMNVQYLKSE
ncbi:hypothetical protein RhiirC2_795109 [Rhizophagus irregularis]|uniref:RRM domain-containing protein n=1 Tax=Rhizophagus irregularis TaxID=588596 RepID=A0A2N1MC75_9GLOM|nr:hypothetical protein RhiirC2_795109 [Rhizophagus irregularis]